jgi:hypothetical protein
MKTILYTVVGLAALLLPAWTVSRAAEPAEPADKGHVLLLANERVLEGEIERVGNQYRVRRSLGETWVPADKVTRLCPDLDAALAFLRARANLNDPDERLRLARWCHLYGLKIQAIDEVQAAVKLRPEHRESRRLLDHLQQTAAQGEPSPSATPPDAATPSAPVDLSADAIAQFCNRVQPILMNACASCHATGRGGSFKLTRVHDEQTLSRKTVQQNLTAVLGQVNAQRPLGSALLTKSVTAHGDLVQAPLKGRQAVPYRTLEEWVRRTIESNPQMQDQAAAPAESAPPAETPFAEDRSPRTTPAPAPLPSMPPITPAVAPTPRPTETPAAKPETPAAPVDPFDPVQFNRERHPDRKP